MILKSVEIWCILQLVVRIQGYDPKKLCSFNSNDNSMLNEMNKKCYIKEVLATLPHNPNQMAVDTVTNVLYFSFDSGQGDYSPGVFRIESKRLSVLEGIKDAFAIAYDEKTGDIYFGGTNGLYRYNSVELRCHRLNRDDLDVWWLTINNGIYFIKFPSLNAYYYSNKTVRPVNVLKNVNVQQFVFDKNDNMFFINSSGLYGVRRQDSEHILLRDNPKFVSIAVDNVGNVYVCSDDGIFMINKIIQKVKRVVNVQGVLGLTFDAHNNMIYSNSHEIVRLLPVSHEEYLDNQI